MARYRLIRNKKYFVDINKSQDIYYREKMNTKI